MTEILLFGGTTEGRKIAEFLSQAGIDFTLSVATQTGEAQTPPCPRLLTGRMDKTQIRAAVAEYTLIIDATHPYASAVTSELRAACDETGREYLRVLREDAKLSDDIVYVEDAAKAAEYLNSAGGNILLTTGSKTAEYFTKVGDFEKRVYLRMLPVPAAIEKCLAMGFNPANLICMQGPFTRELNEAMLKMFGAATLVTKDSGVHGGFPEKLEAARAVGAKVVVIEKPPEPQGLSLEEAIIFLRGRFNIPYKQIRRFPLFVDLSGKTVTVIGGGKIAARRIEILLEFTGNITVISPELNTKLKELYAAGKIRWIARDFENGDLKNTDIVLAVTNRREINHAVAKEAGTLKIPCSVADDKDEGSFWFPGLIQTEKLIVGLISPDGDHKKVKYMKEKISGVICDETYNPDGQQRE